MLFPFKLRIFKQHKGRKQDGWLRFDYVWDLKDAHIIAFEEHVLWDIEGTPTRCLIIYFSDESNVYGCYSMDKFMEIYQGEYMKLYTECVTSRLVLENAEIQSQEEPPKKWYQFWKR